jgi:hypothetical protein
MELSIHDGDIDLTCSHCKNPILKGSIIYQLVTGTYDSPFCTGQGIMTEAMGLRGEMEDVLGAGDRDVAVDDSLTIEDSDFELWDKNSPIMIVLREDSSPLKKGEIIKAKSVELENDMLLITTYSGHELKVERSLVDVYC